MANNNNKETEDSKKGASKKRNIGRRKIPIEKIKDPTKKHVTFSKRRLGLFKKASELCVLCGVEMAILTSSERGKLFCFGHPNSDNIIHRYLNCGSCCLKEQDHEHEHKFSSMVEENNRQHKEIKRKIDEKKRFADHNGSCGFWWEEASVNEMGLDELEELKDSLMELRNNVAKKADELNVQMSNIVFDHINTDNSRSNNSGRIGNAYCVDSVCRFDTPVLGMISNNNHRVEVQSRDGDVVAQSVKFTFKNEVHMTNETDMFNFAVMNQYHQVSVTEDHKGTAMIPGVVHQQGFEFGNGNL
ncbi:hypothetical protein BVRB_1g007900 [Beta vulgaris subsp. vulgaris]|uniref:agamous-like MADS-box protein AGL61 n=1 Tax=Beta vulgaris subsp. vulgaris TaxID=3555 RepID=UPI00053FD3EB|nr:agamous-like MADS-box protein AGL61 [Beta vulgaris subsp. vulgaris]KMT19735.1 hypothetical protein BVRB_1g007900 [Beta vulgaris subsp. vulgaris]